MSSAPKQIKLLSEDDVAGEVAENPSGTLNETDNVDDTTDGAEALPRDEAAAPPPNEAIPPNESAVDEALLIFTHRNPGIPRNVGRVRPGSGEVIRLGDPDFEDPAAAMEFEPVGSLPEFWPGRNTVSASPSCIKNLFFECVRQFGNPNMNFETEYTGPRLPVFFNCDCSKGSKGHVVMVPYHGNNPVILEACAAGVPAATLTSLGRC